jgi:hypothetical protein
MNGEQRLLLITDKPTILEECIEYTPTKSLQKKPKDVNLGLGNTRISTDYAQSSPGRSLGAAFILGVSPCLRTLPTRDCGPATVALPALSMVKKKKVEPAQVRFRDHVSK